MSHVTIAANHLIFQFSRWTQREQCGTSFSVLCAKRLLRSDRARNSLPHDRKLALLCAAPGTTVRPAGNSLSSAEFPHDQTQAGPTSPWQRARLARHGATFPLTGRVSHAWFVRVRVLTFRRYSGSIVYCSDHLFSVRTPSSPLSLELSLELLIDIRSRPAYCSASSLVGALFQVRFHATQKLHL
jgi:hypothetical protein